jgi:hypothetical protein
VMIAGGWSRSSRRRAGSRHHLLPIDSLAGRFYLASEFHLPVAAVD